MVTMPAGFRWDSGSGGRDDTDEHRGRGRGPRERDGCGGCGGNGNDDSAVSSLGAGKMKEALSGCCLEL